jgi:hypothetical protein
VVGSHESNKRPDVSGSVIRGIQSPTSTLADACSLAIPRRVWSRNGPTKFHVYDKRRSGVALRAVLGHTIATPDAL